MYLRHEYSSRILQVKSPWRYALQPNPSSSACITLHRHTSALMPCRNDVRGSGCRRSCGAPLTRRAVSLGYAACPTVDRPAGPICANSPAPIDEFDRGSATRSWLAQHHEAHPGLEVEGDTSGYDEDSSSCSAVAHRADPSSDGSAVTTAADARSPRALASRFPPSPTGRRRDT